MPRNKRRHFGASQSSIESEKVQTLKEIKQDVATLVVAASEKILRGKLDQKKDHELITESIREGNKPYEIFC
jgi:F0F1-type ATP synthase membrane subunit b/b'